MFVNLILLQTLKAPKTENNTISKINENPGAMKLMAFSAGETLFS
jgi:hypothetical protein